MIYTLAFVNWFFECLNRLRTETFCDAYNRIKSTNARVK